MDPAPSVAGACSINSIRIIALAPEGFDVEDEAGFSPERIPQSGEALQIMVAAIYELPETVRIVFSHYHFDGVALVEIARRMSAPTSTCPHRNMTIPYAVKGRHTLGRGGRRSKRVALPPDGSRG